MIPVRVRLLRLVVGLELCGIGLAAIILADLGLGPWDVLHQGLSVQTGIPIGMVTILVGFAVLAMWIPLGERLGIGTVLNVLLIGTTIDVALWLVDEPDGRFGRWVFLLGGTALFALGSGFYIGAGLGPGPRDGLMTAMAGRGHPVVWVRGGLEVIVLIAGWLLGGTVGVGTVVFAFGIGPLVHVALDRLSLPPRPRDRPRR